MLGALYKRYMHLVYGVCLRYLADRDEAQDGVMQVFEKLIEEIPGHEIRKFRSWLYVLTRNHCLMQIRSGKSRARKMDDWIKDQAHSVEFDDEMHPVEKADAARDRALMDCIGKLKNEQKDCIQLFYFENKSYREIADFLRIEEKKVKSHLQNGKRNLKICLEESDAGEEKIQ